MHSLIGNDLEASALTAQDTVSMHKNVVLILHRLMPASEAPARYLVTQYDLVVVECVRE